MQTDASADRPRVTLIVPVRNEAAHIEACLAALTAQDYPADRLEIIVADGASDDATASLVEVAARGDARIRLIPNPARQMAAGLNAGIAEATGELIGVISGHSIVEPDYVSRVVANLERTGAWSTGGAIVRTAETSMQRAIAAATGSPIGVGDARHNYGSQAGWTESVFPGTWPRHVFERVGAFDPRMTFNEDNELSLRIRKAGGRIWYDPEVRVRYVPRGSLRGLFTQYRRYARGRVRVFRKHGAGLGWRHAVPPLLLGWVVVGGAVTLAWPPAGGAWMSGIGAYLLAVAVGSAMAARDANVALVALATMTMHVAYGIGILQGLVDLLRPEPA